MNWDSCRRVLILTQRYLSKNIQKLYNKNKHALHALNIVEWPSENPCPGSAFESASLSAEQTPPLPLASCPIQSWISSRFVPSIQHRYQETTHPKGESLTALTPQILPFYVYHLEDLSVFLKVTSQGTYFVPALPGLGLVTFNSLLFFWKGRSTVIALTLKTLQSSFQLLCLLPARRQGREPLWLMILLGSLAPAMRLGTNMSLGFAWRHENPGSSIYHLYLHRHLHLYLYLDLFSLVVQ